MIILQAWIFKFIVTQSVKSNKCLFLLCLICHQLKFINLSKCIFAWQKYLRFRLKPLRDEKPLALTITSDTPQLPLVIHRYRRLLAHNAARPSVSQGHTSESREWETAPIMENWTSSDIGLHRSHMLPTEQHLFLPTFLQGIEDVFGSLINEAIVIFTSTIIN